MGQAAPPPLPARLPSRAVRPPRYPEAAPHPHASRPGLGQTCNRTNPARVRNTSSTPARSSSGSSSARLSALSAHLSPTPVPARPSRCCRSARRLGSPQPPPPSPRARCMSQRGCSSALPPRPQPPRRARGRPDLPARPAAAAPSAATAWRSGPCLPSAAARPAAAAGSART